MNYLYSTFIFILIISINSNIYSQNNVIDLNYYKDLSLPLLTKEEMKEDLDTLQYYINNLYPFSEILYSIKGININDSISQYKRNLDSVNTTQDFVNLIGKVINLVDDGHFNIPVNDLFINNISNKLDFILEDSATFESSKSIAMKLNKSNKKFSIPISYIDGDYYNYASFQIDNTIYPRGMILNKVNNILIDSFVNTHLSDIFLTRYDPKLKKNYAEFFFNNSFLNKDDSITLEFLNGGTVHSLKFDLNMNVKFVEYNTMHCRKSTPLVIYYPEIQTILIRFPSMRLSTYNNIKDTLINYFSTKKIKNVIIDVRGNAGGTDESWERLVALLIGNCVKSEIFCGMNSNLFKDKLLFYGIDSTMYKFSIANKILTGDYCCVTTRREIMISDTSLNFNGKIFVFYDDKIFSSTSSFISFIQDYEKVELIGKRGGYIRYSGFTPLTFKLHNLKLYLSTPINFDMTNIKSLNDFYPIPSFDVIPDHNYYYFYNTIPDIDYYAYPNISKKDSFFIKFLEIIE